MPCQAALSVATCIKTYAMTVANRHPCPVLFDALRQR
jgi:hypothetical protein